MAEMVQLEELQARLKKVHDLAGNTCVLIEGMTWGGMALNRESALKKESEKKWVIHLIGPDDIIPQPDELTALREANQLNIGMAKMRADDPSDNDPHCWAVVKDAAAESV